MNVIARLEFELVYSGAQSVEAVEHFNSTFAEG